jgi:hypothetical protein
MSLPDLNCSGIVTAATGHRYRQNQSKQGITPDFASLTAAILEPNFYSKLYF